MLLSLQDSVARSAIEHLWDELSVSHRRREGVMKTVPGRGREGGREWAPPCMQPSVRLVGSQLGSSRICHAKARDLGAEQPFYAHLG